MPIVINYFRQQQITSIQLQIIYKYEQQILSKNGYKEQQQRTTIYKCDYTVSNDWDFLNLREHFSEKGYQNDN